MNAGIADAMNLSWLLAAHLNGWAPAEILDAYEAERWPITSQVSRFAMSHAEQRSRGVARYRLRSRGRSDGERARPKSGGVCYQINVQQYCCGGLNFGTYYERVADNRLRRCSASGLFHDGYTPSTVPGCRTPHCGSPMAGLCMTRWGRNTHCCGSIAVLT